MLFFFVARKVVIRNYPLPKNFCPRNYQLLELLTFEQGLNDYNQKWLK